MKKYKYKKKVVPVIDKVFCNKCGKDIAVKEHKGEGFIRGCRAEMRHGYCSKNDGALVKFELCDECEEEFTKNFKHKCEVTEEL